MFNIKTKRGFTMLELMIVVGIVGLLAAVAIPKYGDLLEKANLGGTLGNLASLRSAASMYYGNNMVYPGTIDPKLQPKMSDIISGEMPYVKAHYPISNSPFGNNVTVEPVSGITPTAKGTGWFYNKADGTVFINSIEKDIKGQTAYSEY